MNAPCLCLLLSGLSLLSPHICAEDDKKPPTPPAPTQPSIKIEGETAAEILRSVMLNERRLRVPDSTKADYAVILAALDKALADATAKPEEKRSATLLKTRVLYFGSKQMPGDFQKPFDDHVGHIVKTAPGSDEAAMAQGFQWMGKYASPAGGFDPAGEAPLLEMSKTYSKSAPVGQLVGMFADSIEDDSKAAAFLKKAIAVYGDSPVAEDLKPMLVNRSLVGSVLDLSGPTLDGNTYNLADDKGKVVLVDFWATWCGPCIKEMPNVRKVYDRLKDKGFTVVAISLDEEKETLAKYVREKEIPWPQIIFGKDEELGWTNPLAKKFGINAIPATFLVGKDGKVLARNLRGEEQLEKAVLEALGEKK